MKSETDKPQIDTNKGTLMLVSGDLDKALVAFEIATGFAAMGMEINMWFTLYGVNCIKKPRGLFSLSRWFRRNNSPVCIGRKKESDHYLQQVLGILNHDGAGHLPLSQLNLFGMGPKVFNKLLKQKNIPDLSGFIKLAEELNIKFKICQVCVDVMALDVEEDLVVKAEVLGVSSYAMDSRTSHYNVVL